MKAPEPTTKSGTDAASTPAGESPKARRSRGWIGWIVLVVVTLGAGWWLFGRTPPPAPDTSVTAAVAPMALSPVEVAVVAPQNLRSTIRLTGTLNPTRRSVLAAQVAAPLMEVTVKAGQTVKAGDVLIRFDPTQLQLQVDQATSNLASAEAQLKLAQTTLDNTRRLVERNVSARNTLDKAENDVTAAEANVAGMRTQLKSAETQLGYATIVAPFDGVVSERRVDPGDTVAIGTQLLTLVDTSQLEVEVVIPSSVIGSVEVGQTADLRVDGIEGQTFPARIDRISPVALAATRTIPVYLTLDNPGGILKGGMFTSGEVTTESKDGAIALPATAIRTDDQGSFVLAITGGKLERRAVTTARTWNNGQTVEIATGVAPGDTIVTAPLPTLAAGEAVTVEQS